MMTLIKPVRWKLRDSYGKRRRCHAQFYSSTESSKTKRKKKLYDNNFLERSFPRWFLGMLNKFYEHVRYVCCLRRMTWAIARHSRHISTRNRALAGVLIYIFLLLIQRNARRSSSLVLITRISSQCKLLNEIEIEIFSRVDFWFFLPLSLMPRSARPLMPHNNLGIEMPPNWSRWRI